MATEFTANVLPWDSQINPIPLIESQGQAISYNVHEGQGLTVYTLTAVYPTKEQFLHVLIAFSRSSSYDEAGYAHYLWRIISGE